MKNVILYPKRPVGGQSFVGEKRHTCPGQALSLREILKRFVRRESLPQYNDGVYDERFGDLEKIARMDMFDQLEHVKVLKEQIAAFEKRQADQVEADRVAAEAAREAEIIAAAEKRFASAPPEGKGAQKPAP